jgi:hypothetical protein
MKYKQTEQPTKQEPSQQPRALVPEKDWVEGGEGWVPFPGVGGCAVTFPWQTKVGKLSLPQEHVKEGSTKTVTASKFLSRNRDAFRSWGTCFKVSFALQAQFYLSCLFIGGASYGEGFEESPLDVTLTEGGFDH